jgi:hypothetical protein
VATLRTGLEAVLVTCAPVTCAAPSSEWTFAGRPGTVWVAPTTPAPRVASFEPGMVRFGERTLSVEGNAVAPGSGAVAASGAHVYATAAEATTRPHGLRITIGASAREGEPREPESGYWQQVLWRCDQSHCRRQVLNTFRSAAGREMLAVGADGRVLIVREDRILLVSAAASS